MSITPQAIGGATRRLMATKDWVWRHTLPSDAVERQAAEILRDQANYARRWLWLVGQGTIPLPIGNGSGGPWNRIPCITPAGRYGMVDIAAGRAVEYDICVPWRVTRFATPIERAMSVHDAGGNGGIPGGWRQICLMLGGDGTRCVRVPSDIQPIQIIWGLSDCYRGIGSKPTSDEYKEEWAVLAATNVEIIETAEPQCEEIDLGNGVNAEMWDDFRKTASGRSWWADHIACGKCTITHSGGHTRGLDYVYVTGTREQRAIAIAIAYLTREWSKYVRAQAIKSIESLYRQTGQEIPNTPEGRYNSRDHRIGAVVANALIDSLRSA